MSSRNLRDFTMTGAAVLLTVAALVMAAIRVLEYRDQRVGAVPRGKRVSNPEEYSTGGIRVGNPSAKITVVEFSDFPCPFCRAAAGDLRSLRAEYGADILFVYRHLPGHENSFEAAAAAECADRVGRFVEMHDSLFAKPEEIGRRPWSAWALDAGIRDTSRFVDCLADSAVATRIKRDAESARRLAITGTPTILVGNTRFESNPGADRMGELVREALNEQAERR